MRSIDQAHRIPPPRPPLVSRETRDRLRTGILAGLVLVEGILAIFGLLFVATPAAG